jgi:hypothetical protein
VVIDEFQNIYHINSSIYGELQNIIDERKETKKNLKIAVAGSSYTLMNKVFSDVASPLYGRRTIEISLSHLPPKELLKELKIPIEEFIELWSVFEGSPYYYEFIDPKEKAKSNIKRLIVSKNAQLKNEGQAILSIEFGKDSKTYNTILSSISEGKTKLNEIASLFGNQKSSVSKYLDFLRNEFHLVARVTPITIDPAKSREGRYEIRDNFLSFWFLFVDRLKSYAEQERYDEIDRFFEANFNSYVGRKFEKFVIEAVRSGSLTLPFKPERAGNQWGRIPNAAKAKCQYEIDLVALNEETKEIGFFECKWKDLSEKETRALLEKLKEKSKSVDWNKDKRKEYFGIIAKKIENKNKLRKEDFLVFDLEDF